MLTLCNVFFSSVSKSSQIEDRKRFKIFRLALGTWQFGTLAICTA